MLRQRQRKNEEHKVDNFDLDFETCVLKGYAECQFVIGSNTNDFGGHRSLVSQFCGHDQVSTRYSS